jgi:nicotinamidase-related amidase
MQPYTLIVIDAQPCFLGEIVNRNKVIKNIKHQIKIAMDNNCPVVFVEMNGSTSRSILTDKVRKYKRLSFVQKDDCDGSREICAHMLYNRLPAKNVRICGIYSSQCLADSARGLLGALFDSKIYIVKSACGDSCMDDHEYALGNLEVDGAIII